MLRFRRAVAFEVEMSQRRTVLSREQERNVSLEGQRVIVVTGAE